MHSAAAGADWLTYSGLRARRVLHAVLHHGVVFLLEAAAGERILGVLLHGVGGDLPAVVQQRLLLVGRDGQAGAGQAELQDVQQEQHQHVEEEHHLVVFDGADQAEHSDDEQQHAAGHDAADHTQAGDDAGRLAVGGHANQQEGHHLMAGAEGAGRQTSWTLTEDGRMMRGHIPHHALLGAKSGRKLTLNTECSQISYGEYFQFSYNN